MAKIHIGHRHRKNPCTIHNASVVCSLHVCGKNWMNERSHSGIDSHFLHPLYSFRHSQLRHRLFRRTLLLLCCRCPPHPIHTHDNHTLTFAPATSKPANMKFCFRTKCVFVLCSIPNARCWRDEHPAHPQMLSYAHIFHDLHDKSKPLFWQLCVSLCRTHKPTHTHHTIEMKKNTKKKICRTTYPLDRYTTCSSQSSPSTYIYWLCVCGMPVYILTKSATFKISI